MWSMEEDEGSDQTIRPHWVAAHAHLKNEFSEDEKHHLMSWLKVSSHTHHICFMLHVSNFISLGCLTRGIVRNPEKDVLLGFLAFIILYRNKTLFCYKNELFICILPIFWPISNLHTCSQPTICTVKPLHVVNPWRHRDMYSQPTICTVKPLHVVNPWRHRDMYSQPTICTVNPLYMYSQTTTCSHSMTSSWHVQSTHYMYSQPTTCSQPTISWHVQSTHYVQLNHHM